MKKSFVLFLLLSIISWKTLLSQSNYTLSIEREYETISHCAIATENNDVIAIVNGSENGISELIRINESGNITDSLVFSSNPDRFYKIGQIGKSIHEDTYFGLGWQWTDFEGLFYLWLFEFDDDFNILWERIIDTLDYSPAFVQFRHWDQYYFVGIYIEEIPYFSTFLYRTTQYGELLKKISLPYPEEPNSNSILMVSYISRIPGSSLFLMNRGFYDLITAVMDDDLNYLYTIQPTVFPNKNPGMRFPLDLEFFNDTEFIRSGKIEKQQSDYRNLLAVKKMDTASRNEAKIRKFGYEGFDFNLGCYPGALKALSMHSDYFFIGGWAYGTNDPYPELDNFIMTYAFNYDLDSLWATNIGKDAYYVLYYVSPSPDGGCVLAASRYDWRKGDKKRNAFIVKLPKPDFTSISEAEKPKSLATIFPNPGSKHFLVQTELTHFTLQLYDLQGQLLLTQQNIKEVNTKKLPAGCYIYRIVADDGRATNGKWVKE